MTEVIAKREALHYERHVDRHMQITYQKIGNPNKSDGSYPCIFSRRSFPRKKASSGNNKCVYLEKFDDVASGGSALDVDEFRNRKENPCELIFK